MGSPPALPARPALRLVPVQRDPGPPRLLPRGARTYQLRPLPGYGRSAYVERGRWTLSLRSIRWLPERLASPPSTDPLPPWYRSPYRLPAPESLPECASRPR